MIMKYRFFFKKKLRLLTFKDFQRVFINKPKTRINFLLKILTIKNTFNFPRLGIIVSKKVSKHAYKRNLIKRLIRESFRLSQYYLLNYDFVIIATLNILKINRLKLIFFLKKMWIKYYF